MFKKAQVIYYEHFDDGYLGNVEIQCKCGRTFEKEHCTVDDEVTCPYCEKVYIIKYKLEIFLREKGGYDEREKNNRI